MNIGTSADPIDFEWRGEIREHRRFFQFTGITAIVLGALAILMPHVATLAASLVLGALFLVNGVIACVTAFRARRAGRTAMGFFLGLLFVIAGAALLFDPEGGVLALTVVLTLFLIVSGLMKLYFGWRLRPAPGAGWMMFGGALSILLGIVIASGLPGTAFWVLGLIIGIDLIFYGIALLAALRAA